MRNKLPRHYFEASVYISVLNQEEIEGYRRWWHSEKVLEEAEKGNAVAVTSSLTLAEVTGGRGRPPHAATKDRIREFFTEIDMVEVDRSLAERARSLIWQHRRLRPNDAIHLAAAIVADCDVLFTYDDDLLGINDQVEIRIERPHWEGAEQMPLLVATED